MGIRIGPNRGLSAAALIAQGAEKFMGAYQGQQARQTAAAFQQQQIQSENELRRMQMEKIRQEIAPVEFDAQKLNLLFKGVDSGLVPESVYKKNVEGFVDGIDSPAKLRAASNMLNQAQMQKNAQLGGQNYGSVPPGGGAFMPGYAPTASRPGTFTMSPKEAELAGKLVTARGQMAATGVRARAADLDYTAKLADIDSRLAQAQNKQDHDSILAEKKAALEKELANLRGGYQVQAAKISAGARSNKATDEYAKSLLKIVQQKEKTVSDLIKPASGLDMSIPGTRERSLEIAQKDLLDAKAKYDSYVGGASQPAKAPVKSAAPKQASVSSFKRSDADVVSKMKALKEGALFTLDGEKYKIQGGKPVKE